LPEHKYQFAVKKKEGEGYNSTMTVSVYITRQPDNKEQGFEYSYERIAALQIAKALWRKYDKSPTHYALIANVDTPPVDIVIATENGMGVIDLKNYNGPLSGTDKTEWLFLDENGKPVKSTARSSHLNPVQQVKGFKDKVRIRLLRYMTDNRKEFPLQPIEGRFFLQAAVVFTAQRFDLSRLKIDPALKTWFSLKWMDEAPDWAYSLAFGSGFRITRNQIHLIATQLFRTKPWVEIEGSLHEQEPYGYLWMLIDGKEVAPLSLDQDEVILGRAADVGLSVGDRDEFKLVSREHARLRRATGAVLITDNSKHGTWINGRRLPPREEYVLIPGDRIVLGLCNENGQPKLGACELVYRPLPRSINVTASKEIDV
jgi:hypothetical protein